MTAGQRFLPPAKPAGDGPGADTLRVPGFGSIGQSWAWLALGVVLFSMTAQRWNVALLAWIAPVPFLVAAHRLRTTRGSILLLLAVITAASLQTLKMITSPLSPAMALMFSVPAGVQWWLLLAVWAWLRRRLGSVWAMYGFVALSTLSDWASIAFGLAGSWATTANSQIDNLPLMQLTALGGLPLVGALIALVSGNIFLLIDAPMPKAHWPHAALACLALLAALTWGAVRLDELDLGPTLRAGAVVTHLGMNQGMPDAAALAANADDLFARTETAARRGAQIVAWNEVATLVAPGEEDAIRSRGSLLARRLGIDFVMAYGVVVQTAPLLLDNKYAWFAADGSTLEVYRKHHPVPGEASLRGDAPLGSLERPWGRAAGAICYDYDFPALARAQARSGAGLVVVPASDWRGIDPVHALMARVRGIEGGMSVVRPVRGATSMMFDGYGRERASLGAWEENDGILIGVVPTQGRETPYSLLGDWPAGVAALFLLVASMRSLDPRRDPSEETKGIIR